MTARDKFQRGQRVQFSDEGRRVLHGRRAVGFGVVVGFGHKPYLVTILRDGLKTRECYHLDFWEPVPADHGNAEPVCKPLMMEPVKGPRFPHVCPGAGCAICGWVQREVAADDA